MSISDSGIVECPFFSFFFFVVVILLLVVYTSDVYILDCSYYSKVISACIFNVRTWYTYQLQTSPGVNGQSSMWNAHAKTMELTVVCSFSRLFNANAGVLLRSASNSYKIYKYWSGTLGWVRCV